MTATFKLPEVVTTKRVQSVTFAPRVVLTKIEVFEACEWLAAAQRLLLEHGHDEEAVGSALSSRVSRIASRPDNRPSRMVATRQILRSGDLGLSYFESACSGLAGSNSSESELMQ